MGGRAGGTREETVPGRQGRGTAHVLETLTRRHALLRLPPSVAPHYVTRVAPRLGPSRRSHCVRWEGTEVIEPPGSKTRRDPWDWSGGRLDGTGEVDRGVRLGTPHPWSTGVPRRKVQSPLHRDSLSGRDSESATSDGPSESDGTEVRGRGRIPVSGSPGPGVEGKGVRRPGSSLGNPIQTGVHRETFPDRPRDKGRWGRRSLRFVRRQSGSSVATYKPYHRGQQNARPFSLQ